MFFKTECLNFHERKSLGSHVTDRDCRLRSQSCKQLLRPRPRRWSVLCPWAVVRLLLHLLLLLLTPRHHSRTSAVVTGRCEGSCDAQLLMSPPRALASLPAPAGTGCAAGSSDACSHHQRGYPLGFAQKNGLLTTQGNACLCKTPGGGGGVCGGGEEGRGRGVCVVVVVMVVRTEFCTCTSVHTRTRMQLVKMDQCQCTGPFGWTDQVETPYVCSLRRQVPGVPGAKTHLNPKARKKIARHAHLTPLSFGRREAQSFPSPRRWMPWIRNMRKQCTWTCLPGTSPLLKKRIRSSKKVTPK